MTDISVSGNSPPSVSVSGSTVSVSVSSGVGPQGPAGKDGAGGVATLNGLTVTLTIASAGGVTASGTTLTIGGGGGASSWDDLTGKPNLVYSVAGRTGTVTLTTADISGFSAAASSAAPVQSVAGRTGAVTLTTADVSGYQSPPVTSVAGRTGDVTVSTSDVTGFAAAAASAAPVQSVAGRTGAVTLSTSDVAGYVAPAVTSVAGRTGAVTLSTTDISGYVAPPVSSVAGATGTVTFTAIGLATSQLGSAVTLDASPVYATPAAISASQNNYAPGSGDILRLSSSSTSTLNITGFSTSSMSNQVLLINVSTHTSSVLAVKHSSSSSVSTNQVLVPWAGDCLLPPNGGSAVVIRDATSSVWRIA
jgi:hypothetical protein